LTGSPRARGSQGQACLLILSTALIQLLQLDIDTRGHVTELLEVLPEQVILIQELALKTNRELIVYIIKPILKGDLAGVSKVDEFCLEIIK
jgi:hypothetical protein